MQMQRILTCTRLRNKLNGLSFAQKYSVNLYQMQVPHFSPKFPKPLVWLVLPNLNTSLINSKGLFVYTQGPSRLLSLQTPYDNLSQHYPDSKKHYFTAGIVTSDVLQPVRTLSGFNIHSAKTVQTWPISQLVRAYRQSK